MAGAPPDEKLMLYLDGELSRDEARDVERALDEQSRRKVDALGQLGDILKARMVVAEDDADARLAAMWDRIRPELKPAPARRRRLWDTLRDWFESYRSHVLTGAVAATAGALLATLISGGGVKPSPHPAAARTAAEIDSLEVPDGSAMVFQIPDEATTVIWLTDNEGEGPI